MTAEVVGMVVMGIAAMMATGFLYQEHCKGPEAICQLFRAGVWLGRSSLASPAGGLDSVLRAAKVNVTYNPRLREKKQTGTRAGALRGACPWKTPHVPCPASSWEITGSLSRATSRPAFLASSHCQPLQLSVPCWKQLRTSGQSPNWFLS